MASLNLDPSLRSINGAIDQLLCYRVCSGCILKLTIHRGSFSKCIYMLEAQHPHDAPVPFEQPSLHVKPKTPVNVLTGLGDSPVIISICAQIKAHTL